MEKRKVEKSRGIRSARFGWRQVVVLNRVVGVNISEKTRFKQT